MGKLLLKKREKLLFVIKNGQVKIENTKRSEQDLLFKSYNSKLLTVKDESNNLIQITHQLWNGYCSDHHGRNTFYKYDLYDLFNKIFGNGNNCKIWDIILDYLTPYGILLEDFCELLSKMYPEQDGSIRRLRYDNDSNTIHVKFKKPKTRQISQRLQILAYFSQREECDGCGDLIFKKVKYSSELCSSCLCKPLWMR